MKSISRKLSLMIVANFLLGWFFVYSNFVIWDTLNYWAGIWTGKAYWSAFTVIYDSGMRFLVEMINFPFILFWVLMITNLLFAVWLSRSTEKKQNTT